MKDEKKTTEQHRSQRGEPETNLTGAPSGSAPDLPSNLAAAYQQLLSEKKDLFERLVRKQAELENVRKRVEREKEDFLQHATMSLIRALLPTVDSLERGLKHRDEEIPEKFYKGMELIHKELLDVLKRAGLTPVESEGQLFDPHVHQAVETVETDQRRDQEVVEELQRGYKLKQRLLRPAIVKVAVAPVKKDTGHSGISPENYAAEPTDD